MLTGFRSQVVPSYRLLTEEQIRFLHIGTLELLETIGVRVDHDEAVEMLHGAGCRVKGNNVVLFPNWLVEDAIRSAPSRITIYNREGAEAMRLEGRNIHYGLGTDLIHSVDLKSGELRPSVLQDVRNASTVADYCNHVDFVASFALPHDVPDNTMYIECVKAMMETSSKPIFTTAADADDLTYMIEMAEAAAGGAEALRDRPRLIHYSEPTPPLVHSYGAVRKLLLCAEKGVPITYVPADILGGTAPVTRAGGVVQANAEALSGIVIHQLRRKGSPVISGWAVTPLDMKASTYSYASPDRRLTASVFADMYHYYGIPMWSTVGTDSMVFDQQAGMEHAFTILTAALDGCNLIHDTGYLGQGLIGNPAMIVMCNEIISYVKRILGGFELSHETLALDVIRRVGPGGDYLSDEHTLQHFRREIWSPDFINHDDLDVWRRKGSRTYGQVVTDKAIDILQTHKAAPLTNAVQQQLDEIKKRAQRELVGRSFVV